MEALALLTHKGARGLFETLSVYPKRQFSINELAREAGLPFTTTWKLVQKFEQANVIEVGLVGKSRAVKYRESPFSALVAEILRLSKSPQALSLPELKRALKQKKAIREAYLFGSVASNRERLESDIDVAMLVDQKIDTSGLMLDLHEKYGVKIVPLAFDSKSEFDDFLDGKKKVRLV